jgi:tetratricopeptide (TPR) repeat protein
MVTTDMKSCDRDTLRRTLFQLRRRRAPFARKELWFAEIARLRAMLRTGSPELEAFEAIEVQGMTIKAAAVKLGFSERHLYRVRLSMLEQLSTPAQQQISIESLPPVEREIELASAMLARGHSAAVLSLVQRTLDSPASPTSVVEALTLRARSLSESETFSAAEATLTEARRYVNSMPAQNGRVLMRGVHIAHAYDLYCRGLYEKAIDIAERALAGARPQYAVDPYETRALARQLIFLGIMHQEGGSPYTSLTYLDKAQGILNTLPLPPSAELTQIRIHSAFTRGAIPGQLQRARQDARDALQRAEWHGLLYETIWANLAIAMIEEVAERPEAGLAHAHAALALARTSFAGDPLARTLFLTSRVESAMGRHDDSLARLHEADAHVGQAGLMRGILHVAEARIHRDAGRTCETIESSTRAIGALESKSQSHYIGIPYLARAKARFAKGERNVHTDVEAALYYLDRGGSVKDLALALELSYRVSGNRACYERARELRAGA